MSNATASCKIKTTLQIDVHWLPEMAIRQPNTTHGPETLLLSVSLMIIRVGLGRARIGSAPKCMERSITIRSSAGRVCPHSPEPRNLREAFRYCTNPFRASNREELQLHVAG
jgi:hypothetical protein